MVSCPAASQKPPKRRWQSPRSCRVRTKTARSDRCPRGISAAVARCSRHWTVRGELLQRIARTRASWARESMARYRAVSRPAGAGSAWCSVVPLDAAGAAHEPSTHRQPSPVGRWDREMAQHHSNAQDRAQLACGVVYGTASGLTRRLFCRLRANFRRSLATRPTGGPGAREADRGKGGLCRCQGRTVTPRGLDRSRLGLGRDGDTLVALPPPAPRGPGSSPAGARPPWWVAPTSQRWADTARTGAAARLAFRALTAAHWISEPVGRLARGAGECPLLVRAHLPTGAASAAAERVKGANREA